MLSNEIWKPVVGYEELYEVSNKGRVKALKRRKNCNRGYGFIKEHIMKPNNHGTCDYYRVPLTSKEHIKKYYMVHRLVAKAFIENPNNLPEVNHKDLNKSNNCIDNLEWITNADNKRHYQKTDVAKVKRKEQGYIICPLAPETYTICNEKCEECKYQKEFIEALEERSK